MNVHLLNEIDAFLADSGLSDYRFGILAARNGRLVERLRTGGRVWPETEERIRSFIRDRRRHALMVGKLKHVRAQVAA